MGWLSKLGGLLSWGGAAEQLGKLFNSIAGALAKKNDQDTGRSLQRGDDSQTLAKEAEAVHDAQSDTATVERVRQQSYRD